MCAHQLSSHFKHRFQHLTRLLHITAVVALTKLSSDEVSHSTLC